MSNVLYKNLTKRPQMDLKTYLKEHKIRYADFAADCGLTRTTIYNIITKKHPPRSISMSRIVQVTRGKVTLEDLMVCQHKPIAQRKKLAAKQENI
jgi:predicted transcriptional regulator